VRNRTVPGKYTIGSWQNLEAADAQRELERQVIATQHLMVVRCLYPEGSAFSEHVHPQEQITIVEEGTLEIEVDGEKLSVGPGQMVSINRGVPHACRVLGDQAVRALNLFHAPDPDSPSVHAAGGEGMI